MTSPFISWPLAVRRFWDQSRASAAVEDASHTAPLNFFGELSKPPWERGSKLTPKFDGFRYGSTLTVDNSIDEIVIPASLVASLMSIALALPVFLAAREIRSMGGVDGAG